MQGDCGWATLCSVTPWVGEERGGGERQRQGESMVTLGRPNLNPPPDSSALSPHSHLW